MTPTHAFSAFPLNPTTYTVVPKSTRALCHMIARTKPEQRHPHGNLAADLDLESFAAFVAQAAAAGFTIETTPGDNRIILIPGQPVTARFVGAHSAEILDLFQTDTIPTPYDSREPRQDILEAIQARNPRALVEWEGQPKTD